MPPKSRRGKSDAQKHPKSSNAKSQLSSQKSTPSKNGDSKSLTPTELQQKLLNVFRDAFPKRFEPDLPAWLQEVKRFLYQRDFIRAFDRDEYREAYAVRWSASRSLAYLEILGPIIDGILKERGSKRIDKLEDKLTEPSVAKGFSISCLGGGAGAELVALSGVLSSRRGPSSPPARESENGIEEGNDVVGNTKEDELLFKVDFVDIANWSPILDRLYRTVTTPPPLSAYASAAAKANNFPLMPPSSYAFTFNQHDVLKLHPRELYPLVGRRDLVTLLFTMNELYTTSSLLTQTFLLNLTACMTVGSLLLVVDTAGDYSEVGLGKEEAKKYPMQWLLDRTLLKSATEVGFSHPIDGPGDDESVGTKRERKATEGREKDIVKWKKLREEDSRWFRLPDRLRYPLDLENMRYQLHLYQRIATSER